MPFSIQLFFYEQVPTVDSLTFLKIIDSTLIRSLYDPYRNFWVYTVPEKKQKAVGFNFKAKKGEQKDIDGDEMGKAPMGTH